MTVDCHTHLSTFDHPGQSFTAIRDSLLATMAQQGIGCALVYPDSEPGTGVSDLDTTEEIVRPCPRLRMVGTTPIPLPDSGMIARLDALAAAGTIAGVKLYPGFELFYPDDRRCDPVYELCVRHRLPVVFHSGETMGEAWREPYNHPDHIVQVARRFPALQVVIAHFSQPHLEACRDAVLECPNVHADISGLAHPEVERLCGEKAIARILEEVATRKPERVLFGTDWPIGGVEEHLRLVAALPISDEARALLLSGNAERVFALGRPLFPLPMGESSDSWTRPGSGGCGTSRGAGAALRRGGCRPPRSR